MLDRFEDLLRDAQHRHSRYEQLAFAFREQPMQAIPEGDREAARRQERWVQEKRDEIGAALEESQKAYARLVGFFEGATTALSARGGAR